MQNNKFVIAPFWVFVFLSVSMILTFVIFDVPIKNSKTENTIIVLLVTSIFFTLLTYLVYKTFPVQFTSLKDNYSPYGESFLILLVLMANILEYITLGVPLLTSTNYHTYGYCCIHHISVSSWLFIFMISSKKTKLANFLLLLFAFTNPIFIQNRDILLLTFYSAIVVFSIHKKMSTQKVLMIVIIIVLIFGFLGNIRSPGALNVAMASLPLNIQYEDYPITLMWFGIYLTSSIFNSLYFVETQNHVLYYEHINAVSEFMIWMDKFDYIGIFIFYFFVFSILIPMYLLVGRYPKLISLYVYLNYQAIMTLFSKKLFLTNTIFTILILVIVFFLTKLSNKLGEK